MISCRSFESDAWLCDNRWFYTTLSMQIKPNSNISCKSCPDIWKGGKLSVFELLKMSLWIESFMDVNTLRYWKELSKSMAKLFPESRKSSFWLSKENHPMEWQWSHRFQWNDTNSNNIPNLNMYVWNSSAMRLSMLFRSIKEMFLSVIELYTLTIAINPNPLTRSHYRMSKTALLLLNQKNCR